MHRLLISKIIFIFMACALMGSSCSDDSDDVNNNPNPSPGESASFDQLGFAEDICTRSNLSTDPIPETINTGSADDSDTHDCDEIIEQPGDAEAPELCVLMREDLTVEAGTTLSATGTRALVLFATKSMTISGTVDVSPSDDATGAGVIAELDGEASTADFELASGSAGNGGGGYGTSGAKGGNFGGLNDTLREGTAGGSTYGSETLVPLLAGSSGGLTLFGSVNNGGGALALFSCDTMNLGTSAQVLASGGGGSEGVTTDGAEPIGGGGGGSGGGILVAAKSLNITDGAVIAANGGAGAGGPESVIQNNTATGEFSDPGEDGKASAEAAQGSEGIGASGKGGNGCALDSEAETGEDEGTSAQNTFHSGGGGGGGCGRIRINVSDLSALDLSNAVISPVASTGTLDLD